jgi:hypothetical protein
VQVVSFVFFYLVNYSIWIVALTCLLLQRPSSSNYIHCAPRRALPRLQSRTPQYRSRKIDCASG